jgi:hypothetical protein
MSDKVKVVAKAKIVKTAKAEIKPKFYFDIRVETNVPATFTYRVFAEDAAQAAEMIKGQAPTNIKYKIPMKKDIKLTVYDAGSSIIRWMKNFVR